MMFIVTTCKAVLMPHEPDFFQKTEIRASCPNPDRNSPTLKQFLNLSSDQRFTLDRAVTTIGNIFPHFTVHFLPVPCLESRSGKDRCEPNSR
jgi:hypothetical protein